MSSGRRSGYDHGGVPVQHTKQDDVTQRRLEIVLEYVRMQHGPFGVATLLLKAGLRGADPRQLGASSYARILRALPDLLSPESLATLRSMAPVIGTDIAAAQRDA